MPDLSESREPSPALKSLGRLVGTWKISGEAQGQIRYEWMERGLFLVQHFDLVHDGRKIKGMDISFANHELVPLSSIP